MNRSYLLKNLQYVVCITKQAIITKYNKIVRIRNLVYIWKLFTLNQNIKINKTKKYLYKLWYRIISLFADYNIPNHPYTSLPSGISLPPCFLIFASTSHHINFSVALKNSFTFLQPYYHIKFDQLISCLYSPNSNYHCLCFSCSLVIRNNLQTWALHNIIGCNNFLFAYLFL